MSIKQQGLKTRYNVKEEYEESFTPSQNEESYIPIQRRTRRRMNRSTQMEWHAEQAKKFNESFWSDDENLTYMRFLEEYGQLFDSNWAQRKNIKINVLMSQYIKTRSPLQCRSHHQKMMKFHHSIPQIITHLAKLSQTVCVSSQPTLENQAPSKEMQRWSETEIILQDLSEKIRWAQEQSDIWARIMEDGWLNDLEF